MTKASAQLRKTRKPPKMGLPMKPEGLLAWD
jgi:hypothetical protein